MRTLIGAVVITAGLLCAQTYRELLLPKARSIVGKVTDREGKPIRAARVYHSENHRENIQTGGSGEFKLRTRAPALVIRKPGYRSQWVRTADVGAVPIALEPADSLPQIRACSRTEPCESIDGWSAQFCFSRVPGVTAGPQGHDIDYGFRNYVIDSGRAGIGHGSGPLWSFGVPVDTDVWRSNEYQEKVFGTDPLVTRDARGRTANGKLWRYLGKFGESASYSDVSEDDARLLDRVLDGVCIRSQR